MPWKRGQVAFVAGTGATDRRCDDPPVAGPGDLVAVGERELRLRVRTAGAQPVEVVAAVPRREERAGPRAGEARWAEETDAQALVLSDGGDEADGVG